MLPKKLILQDVRCFSGHHEISVRPLTLLVGENSAGKSTFMAMLRAAGRIDAVNFNEPPFDLGAYEHIARKNDAGEPAPCFKVGAIRPGEPGPEGSDHEGETRIVVTFAERHVQPVASAVEVSFPDGAELTASITGNTVHVVWTLASGRSLDRTAEVPDASDMGMGRLITFVTWNLARPGKGRRTTTEVEPERSDEEEFELELMRQHRFLLWEPIMGSPPMQATAPIRSKPRRTYDPRSDAHASDGAHVPMALARVQSADGATWKTLQDAFKVFGTQSGLMDALEIARKGKKQSDPFQVEVRVGRSRANLVDVGYGVSQVLPVLVEVALAPEGSTLLLQQPEVHLHPRAQAELGTYFAHFVPRGRNLVVETHSDHLVDRVRMEVRDAARSKGKKQGSIRPQDVLILFFERTDGGTRVHELTVNERGDLLGAPSGYRDFFLREEARLLDLGS